MNYIKIKIIWNLILRWFRIWTKLTSSFPATKSGEMNDYEFNN